MTWSLEKKIDFEREADKRAMLRGQEPRNDWYDLLDELNRQGAVREERA